MTAELLLSGPICHSGHLNHAAVPMITKDFFLVKDKYRIGA
jgi:hypothetical protein